MEPTIPSQPSPVQPVTPTPPVPVKPKSNVLSVFVVIILILSLGAVGFLMYQNWQLKQQISQVQSTPTPLASSKPMAEAGDPTANWKTYTNGILNIEFKLPPKLGLLEMSGKEGPGDTGTQYCMIFVGSLTFSPVPKVYAGAGPCGGGQFNLGSVSKDYSAGREGGFGDYTGYVKENGLYYPRFLNSVSSTAFPANIISEKTNLNGITYLKIKGASKMQDYGGEQMSLAIPGTPGEGSVGALFNIQNDKYTGFNIYMPVNSPTDETIFDQILSTFKFTD